MTPSQEYRSLTPWQYPDSYIGQSWYGWFPVYSQNRDSDARERSNYRCILAELRKLDSELAESAIDTRQADYDSAGDSTVCDTSVNHWAVGWVEVIYVNSSNLDACTAADELLCALEDYAIVDESDLSELESEEQSNAWEHGLRSEFRTALGKRLVSEFESGRKSDQRDRETDTDYNARYDATVDWLEDGADISDGDLDQLFWDMAELANEYWEDGYISVDRVIARSLDRAESRSAGMNEWRAKSLAAVRAMLRDAMGDTKYDLGIVRYVDANQLELPFDGGLAC